MVFSIFTVKLPQVQVEQPQTLQEDLEIAKRVTRCIVYFDPSPYLTNSVLPNTEISSLANVTTCISLGSCLLVPTSC